MMFDKAIASLDGMEKFVPRGSKVLVKPNIGWDVTPERAGNTHPMCMGLPRHLAEKTEEDERGFHDRRDYLKKSIGCNSYKNSGIENSETAGGKTISPAAKDLSRKEACRREAQQGHASLFTSSFWARMCSSTSRF